MYQPIRTSRDTACRALWWPWPRPEGSSEKIEAQWVMGGLRGYRPYKALSKNQQQADFFTTTINASKLIWQKKYHKIFWHLKTALSVSWASANITAEFLLCLESSRCVISDLYYQTAHYSINIINLPVIHENLDICFWDTHAHTRQTGGIRYASVSGTIPNQAAGTQSPGVLWQVAIWRTAANQTNTTTLNAISVFFFFCRTKLKDKAGDSPAAPVGLSIASYDGRLHTFALRMIGHFYENWLWNKSEWDDAEDLQCGEAHTHAAPTVNDCRMQCVQLYYNTIGLWGSFVCCVLTHSLIDVDGGCVSAGDPLLIAAAAAPASTTRDEWKESGLQGSLF